MGRVLPAMLAGNPEREEARGFIFHPISSPVPLCFGLEFN
jgi:hypothetical protein